MIFFIYIYIHIYIFYYNTNTNLLFLTNHTLSFVNQIYRVVNYTHTWPTRRNPILTGTITISQRALSLTICARFVPSNTDYGLL